MENDTDPITRDAELYDICDEFIADNIAKEAEIYGEQANEIVKYSLYNRMIEKFADAAVLYVEEQERSDRSENIKYLLRRGVEVVDLIQSSFSKYCSLGTDPKQLTEDELKEHYNFWEGYSQPLQRIINKDTPYIDKDSLIEAVSDYLKLPYRSTFIDRFLVRALVEQELYAFGDQALNEIHLPFIPPMSPLNRPNPLVAFLKSQIWNGIILFGLAVLSIYAVEKKWINEGWGIGILMLLVAIFAIILVMRIIKLPSVWADQIKSKNKVAGILEAMSSIHIELRSHGPISSRHITHVAEIASEKGVIWPSPLFVLLDDINNRGGIF